MQTYRQEISPEKNNSTPSTDTGNFQNSEVSTPRGVDISIPAIQEAELEHPLIKLQQNEKKISDMRLTIQKTQKAQRITLKTFQKPLALLEALDKLSQELTGIELGRRIQAVPSAEWQAYAAGWIEEA